jgi:hypothetical protein
MYVAREMALRSEEETRTVDDDLLMRSPFADAASGSAAPAWPRRRSSSGSSTSCAFRNPVVVGGGTPFLPPVAEGLPQELIETRTFGSRVVDERYGRSR